VAREFDWEKARNTIEVEKLNGLTQVRAGLELEPETWGIIWEDGVYLQPKEGSFSSAIATPLIQLIYPGAAPLKNWICSKRVLQDESTGICPESWLENNNRRAQVDVVYDGMLIKYHPVIKIEDAQKFLTVEQMEQFETIIDVIREGRASEGKSINHVHLIVNTDEPYADRIIEILKANNHWG
jgi:hypothetical protein